LRVLSTTPLISVLDDISQRTNRIPAESSGDSPALDAFLAALPGPLSSGVFNPWLDRDEHTDIEMQAAAHRIARLKAHLSGPIQYLLIGEAAGYQGCKVSGIPFTSERLILEGQIPRIAAPGARLSSRARPWSEPSATTVWKTLHGLGIAEHTVLWNAYPWHPHKPGSLHSNRTPTRSERRSGVPVLEALLKMFPDARRFAVGRNAEASLAELGIEAQVLRHPSMGGAAEFATQLTRAIRPASAR
jgi:hypothetical protein